MSALLLKEPYGYNKGTGVRFTFNNNDYEMSEYKKVFLILMGFSCHPFAVRKIYNSLKYTGQYACYLQASWFFHDYYYLKLLLGQCNINVEPFFFVNEKDEEKTNKIYEEIQKDFDLKDEMFPGRFLKETEYKFTQLGQWYYETLAKRNIQIECD